MNTMGFWKRFRVFIIGFGIGLLIVYGFFGDRACGGWLPGNRVRSEMTEYTFLTNDYMNCQMETANLTPDSLAKFILNSSVKFPPKKNDKIRVYTLINNETKIDFSLNKEDSTMFIANLPIKSFSNCDTLNKKNYKTVKLPFKEILKKEKGS